MYLTCTFKTESQNITSYNIEYKIYELIDYANTILKWCIDCNEILDTTEKFVSGKLEIVYYSFGHYILVCSIFKTQRNMASPIIAILIILKYSVIPTIC